MSQINTSVCRLLDQKESIDLDKCFAGKSVLLSGDFFQFPPVIPKTPLYTSIVNLFGSSNQTPRAKAVQARLATSPEIAGAKLLAKFKKVELTQQMRAAGDDQHIRLINEMCKEKPNMDWVVHQLEHNYPVLNAKLLEKDPEFLFSLIATTGNIEKAVINDCVSKAHAVYQSQPRIVWLQPLKAKGITLSSKSVESSTIFLQHYYATTFSL